MLTPARIFAALALTCTGVLAMADAASLPGYARLLIGAIGLFSGGVVAIAGPVQNNAVQNAIATAAVASAKAADGGK